MPFFGSLAILFGRVLVIALVVVAIFSEISTLAGSGVPGFFDGSVRFYNPSGVAVDLAGNVYVADQINHRIRKITPAGVVTTLAGSGTATFANGTGTNASFNYPTGVVVDSAGNVYVADTLNNTIRKITSSGVVTRLAGSTEGYLDGSAGVARFNTPIGVAVDSGGNVYVGDQTNNRIRKITPGGLVSTLAGNAIAGSTNGTGTNATFRDPAGVAVDSGGNVYVADQSNSLIRKIAPDGVVTTLTGTNPSFNFPLGVAVDSAGTVYVADYKNRLIRKITPAGVVTTLAGSGTAGFADGTGTNAMFNEPYGVAVDSAGNVYVGDNTNQRIRKITSAGVVTTLAGSGVAGFTDSIQTNFRFSLPMGLAFDSAGNLYVGDIGNHCIRRITPAGVVSTFAGTGAAGFADGIGTNIIFNNPYGVAFDSAGIMYVADSGNNRIRKITLGGVVSTFAGSGTYTFADGDGMNASFRFPVGIALDSAGNVYVADAYNNRIRKITPAGVVTTLAGSGTGEGTGTGAFANGTGTSASFSFPHGITLDSTGNVFVADQANHRIRRITPAGVVTTFAGGTGGSTDGNGTNAGFNNPKSVAFDSAGNLYVGEANHRIRRITPEGVVTTFAGSTIGFQDGTGTNARFFSPHGIAIDSTGTLFVADNANNCIRRITSGAVVSTFVGSQTSGYSDGGWFTRPVGVATDWGGTVYVADRDNQRIRKITPAGVVSTFSGDGTANTATFNIPLGVAVNSVRTVYVADSTNRRIRAITAEGVASTFAGSGTSGFADGTGVSATFNTPVGITVDSVGTIYVSDIGNHRIRRITSAGVVTTFAGTTQGFQDGVGTNARFDTPSGIVADIYGNVYVADTNNHDIRRISSDGTVTTLAGSTAGYVDGTGTNAQFNFPYHLSIDALGTLYVADQTNNRIRTIQPSTGVVSTLAGDGTVGFTPSRFSSPQGITVDRFRNAYVGDTGNHSIRKIPNVYTVPENNGVVTTVAGDGTNGFIDANGIGARFSNPLGIAVDSVGNIYVSDTFNHLIRKITPQGLITTFAGNRTAASTDGTGTNASINTPQGIAFDSDGNLYVGEREGYRIRKITAGGVVTTFAGTTFGYLDGTGVAARFNDPRGIAVDSAKNVYVADVRNHCIRKITPAGVVSTLAGQIIEGFLNGTGTNAQFNWPYGVGVDSAGNVYVADHLNLRIRKITSAGVVTTFAGDGTSSFLDGTGTNTKFSYPYGLQVDLADNIYVADYGNHSIRRITPAGVVTTLAGQITAGSNDGTGTNAQFNGPSAVTIYSTGTMYVIETLNNRIRKIGTTVAQVPLNRGVVTTFAGSSAGSTDGTGTNASFGTPTHVAVDLAGNLYVAEGNHRIRKITPAGVVTTLAGSSAGSTDGTGTNASFNSPLGVAVDSAGNVYVGDQANNRIRKITPAGVVSTLAGSLSNANGSTNGTGTAATFGLPRGVAVDSGGNVYVADTGNGSVRRITPQGVVTTLATGFSGNRAVAVDLEGVVYVGETSANLIRKITPAGVVTTLAGSGTAGVTDGTGTNATLTRPHGVAVDSVGNVYVAEQTSHRIRKITPTGVVTTLAGSSLGSTDGTGTNATFNIPTGITVDSGGIVYVVDQSNQRIRKIQ